jgi:hypothetical protein
MDWSDFWIEHAGERRDAGTFGQTFLPELLRVVEEQAPQARSFLEWGTGLSTLLLARLAAQRGGSVVTIDHDAAYAGSVLMRLAPHAPVRSLIADLTGPKRSQADVELNYGSLPLTLGEFFDFILVDGRRRVECLFTAFVLAQLPTVVVLHDYRRTRYRAVSIFFETIEAGEQFWVMRGRPELLRLTTAERARVLQDVRSVVEPAAAANPLRLSLTWR